MKKVLVSALAALAMVVGGVAPAAHAANATGTGSVREGSSSANISTDCYFGVGAGSRSIASSDLTVSVNGAATYNPSAGGTLSEGGQLSFQLAATASASDAIVVTYVGTALGCPTLGGTVLAQNTAVTLTITPLPAAPASLTVTTPQSQRLALSWAAVSGVQGYGIYTSTASTGPWTWAASTMGASTTTYTLSGLSPTTALWVKVVGQSGGVDGNPVISSSATTPNGGVVGGGGGAPGTVASVTVSNTNVSGEIFVSWTAASPADGYQIYMATSSSGPFGFLRNVSGGSTLSVILTGRIPTQAYYFKVCATNGGGPGTQSAATGAVYADGLGSAVGQTVTTTVMPVVPVFKQPKFAMPSKIDVDATGKVSLSGKDMGVSTVLIGGKEQKIDTNSDEKLVFDTTGLAKGVHDLVMKGAFGTYTVQKAIQVGEAVVTKVAAVSARQVGMAGGELSISGQGLEGTTQITMNGQVLEIVSKTDSKVTFKVPASTVASVNSIMIEGSFVPVIFKNAFSYTK